MARTCAIPKLRWLREGATIRTCGRKKAARLGRLIYAIWHRNLRWLRGHATISNCFFERRHSYLPALCFRR